MVQRVVAAPLTERRQGQHARDVADDLTGALPRKERAVRTVVHEDEGAHEQPTRDWRERQRKPEGMVLEQPVFEPQREREQRERGDQLRNRAAGVGTDVGRYGSTPVRR